MHRKRITRVVFVSHLNRFKYAKVNIVQKEQKLFFMYENKIYKNNGTILYCQFCENLVLTDRRSQVLAIKFL